MSIIPNILKLFLPPPAIDWENIARRAHIQVIPYDGEERMQILNRYFPLYANDDSFLVIRSFMLMCDLDESSLLHSKNRPNEVDYIQRFFQIINHRIKNNDFSCLLILDTDPQYFKSIQTSNFTYQFAKSYLVYGKDSKIHFDVDFQEAQIV